MVLLTREKLPFAPDAADWHTAPDDDPVGAPDDEDDDPMPCEVCAADTAPDDLVWIPAGRAMPDGVVDDRGECPICPACDLLYHPATLADCY